MDAQDRRVLVDHNASVQGLKNYFASKPTPSRRELAELKEYVAKRRYPNTGRGKVAFMSDDYDLFTTRNDMWQDVGLK